MPGPRRGRSSSSRGRSSSSRGRSSSSRDGNGPPYPARNPNVPPSPPPQAQQGQFPRGFRGPPPPGCLYQLVHPPVYVPLSPGQPLLIPQYPIMGVPVGGLVPIDANQPRSSSPPNAQPSRQEALRQQMPVSPGPGWVQLPQGIYYPLASPPLPINPMLGQQQQYPQVNPISNGGSSHLNSDQPIPAPSLASNPMIAQQQRHATEQHRYRMTTPNLNMPANFDPLQMAYQRCIAEPDENNGSSRDRNAEFPPFRLPPRERFNRLDVRKVFSILNRNDVDASPEDLYYAVTHWIEAHKSRRKHLRNLLLEVRLILLPVEFLEDIVNNNHLVKTNKGCQTDVLNAIEYRRLFLPERLALSWERKFPDSWKEPDARVLEMGYCRKRISFDPPKRIYVFGGNFDHWRGGESSKTKTFEYFEYKDQTWNTGGDIPTTSDSFGAASYHGTIWIVGGDETIEEGSDVITRLLDSVFIYTPSRDEWNIGPSMKKKRSNIGLIEYKGCLYAIGGKSETEAYEKSVEVVRTPKNLCWTDGVDMNMGRVDMGVAVLRSRIYVVGGVQESDRSQMEYFCSETQQWTCLGIDIPRRDYLGITVNEELMYLMGRCLTKTCNVYNPACGVDGWRELPVTVDSACLLMKTSVVAVYSNIYLIGGFEQGQRVEYVSQYDATKCVWHHKTSSCTSKRADAKIVILNM